MQLLKQINSVYGNQPFSLDILTLSRMGRGHSDISCSGKAIGASTLTVYHKKTKIKFSKIDIETVFYVPESVK